MLTLLSNGDLMVVIWFAVIIIAAIIEASTMDLTSIWFSGGAFLALLVAVIFGGGTGSMIAQISVFIVASAAMLIMLRPVFQSFIKKNEVRTNADRLVGKVAICVKAIALDQRGEVTIDGKIWTAVANETIEINQKVEVLAIEGVKLVVRKQQ